MLNLSQKNHQNGCAWYLKALPIFLRYQDNHNFMIGASNYMRALQATDPATQTLLRQRWQEAGLDQTITLNQLEQQLNDNA
jgi:hypothetical protein